MSILNSNVFAECPICKTVHQQSKSLQGGCCSLDCKKQYTNLLKTKECPQCKTSFVANYKQQKYCSQQCVGESQTQSQFKKFYECKECGKEFRRKRNTLNIFCSRECSFKYKSEHTLALTLTAEEQSKRTARRKAKETELFLSKATSKRYLPLFYNTCVECNSLFLWRREKLCCSTECQYKRNKRQKVLSDHGTLKRECKQCGATYNFGTGEATNSFCSKKCQSKARHGTDKTHKKRVLKFNSFSDGSVSLLRLRRRDGKKCLICGKKVLTKNESGYHKDNASIGHIIALSNSGDHTMQNVQLECMECNMKKGTRDSGQLRLF